MLSASLAPVERLAEKLVRIFESCRKLSLDVRCSCEPFDDDGVTFDLVIDTAPGAFINYINFSLLPRHDGYVIDTQTAYDVVRDGRCPKAKVLSICSSGAGITLFGYDSTEKRVIALLTAAASCFIREQQEYLAAEETAIATILKEIDPETVA